MQRTYVLSRGHVHHESTCTAGTRKLLPIPRACEPTCRDSYWILKGLLVSKMKSTAMSMCYNLLNLLDTYGHIPNGGWILCSGRGSRS